MVCCVEEEVAKAVVCVHDVDRLEAVIALEGEGMEGNRGGVNAGGLVGTVVECGGIGEGLETGFGGRGWNGDGEELQGFVFPDLSVGGGEGGPVGMVGKDGGVELRQCRDAAECGRNKSCVDVVWDMTASNTISTVSPLANNLTLFDVEEIVHCLVASCRERGCHGHDLVRVNVCQVTVGQVLVRRVD